MAPSILIVGCGIAGPTLASWLMLSDIPADQKPHITILERESTRTAHLRGQNVDIRGAGVTIMRKLGLEEQIRASTTDERGVQLVDEQNKVWSQNEVDTTGQIQSPTSDIEILRGRLAELCWKNSQRISAQEESKGAQGIQYIFGDSLDDVNQDAGDDKVHVRFAKSGETKSYDLVVGADGMQSRTRKLVWGQEEDKDRLHRLGMYAGFFSIPSQEHDGKWRRWFHASGRRGIMIRPDHLGVRSTIFMYVVNDGKDERFAHVATRENGGVDAQKALLAESFKEAGWECERIIREMYTTDDFYYDSVSQVKMDSWSKGRVVLLGDAGYCASPISGLGTTLAFGAAYKLAGYLQPYLKGETTDPLSALAEYNEQMRPIVQDAQHLAPGMPHLINTEIDWGIWVMRSLVGCLQYTRIFFYIIKFLGRALHLGPQAANYVAVEDFGFKDMSIWKTNDKTEK